jgi:hypothetical protein
MTHSGRPSILFAAVTLVTIDAYASHPSLAYVNPNNDSPTLSSSRFGSLNRMPMPMPMTMPTSTPMQTLSKTQSFPRNFGIQTRMHTRTRTSTSSITALNLSPNSNDNDPEEANKKDSEVSNNMKFTQKAATLWKLLVTRFMKFFPTLRTALASFTVGAIFALSVIFIPVYNSVDKMSEPVTLFETILAVS